MRRYGEDHFVVRSPALLGLVADWVQAGVPALEDISVGAVADSAGTIHRRGDQ